jgi:UDP-2,3-diacylglucosamine pyrophosphatase LpxH
VDYPENMAWIRGLSDIAFRGDALLLAGDVTHDLARLEIALDALNRKFKHLFYVPGNHELWVMKGESGNSVDKFHRILDLCSALGVKTQPARVGDDEGRVWVVPLFSWYTLPEEGRDSLFLPKRGDAGLQVWSDSYFVKWPPGESGFKASDYFLQLNEAHMRGYDAPVISFSHFLSRQDLMFRYGIDMQELMERAKTIRPEQQDVRERDFNFSRVAGTSALDEQIRKLGSVVHVHGHQHRNRFRTVDGVLYVSHCLGYKHERNKNLLKAIEGGPLPIWDTARPPDVQAIEPY